MRAGFLCPKCDNFDCLHTRQDQNKLHLKRWFFLTKSHNRCTRTTTTVNSEWYTIICLPVVFQEIRKTSRRKGIALHHDNASSHTSAQATAFLSFQNIDLTSHPPYSSDLAPNDFFWFSYVKNKMRDQRFPTPEEAVDAFRMHVLEILVPQSEWQKCFDNWFKRMQKFIDLNGE